MNTSSLRKTSQLDPVEAVDRLVTGLGHRLRSPLTGLRGYGELLGQESESPSRDRWGAGLKDGLQDLELLIEGISRYQVPREIHSSLQPARGLLEEAWRLALRISPTARSRGVELDCDMSSVSVLDVDAFHFRNLLINLLQNALDASPEGGRVRVSDAEDACFVIRDQGPGLGGLSPEEICEPFFTTRRDRAGLGLSVSRIIAERHGCHLRWDEPADGGLRVRVIRNSAEKE